jgi:methionine synthase II (cobalamin-independent)
VDEVAARQISAGIDIVNDGEWGKTSYATYIKDRLNGFGGSALPRSVSGRRVEALHRASRELVAQRIEPYAKLVGRDNVMAGVDCGFSIHVGSGGVDPEVVRAKLGSLSQGAAIASRKFWP